MPLEENDDGLMNPWAFWLFLGFAFFSGILLAFQPVNCDAAWYLYMGERVLDGARPYQDIVDSNPPLIVIFSMQVVLLARTLGVSALSLFQAELLLLAAISLDLSARLSRGLPRGLAQGYLLAAAYAILCRVAYCFGQREHLLVILILPYAQAAAARARGETIAPGLAVVVGLMAGVGFALKPFFVPTVVMVEVYLAVRRGARVWFRAEGLAIAGVFLAYAIVLVGWMPQYFEVARRFAPLYPYHNPMGTSPWKGAWRVPGILLVAGLALRLMRGDSKTWGEVHSLISLGLVAAVFLGGKGFVYQWYPAIAFGLILAGGCGAEIVLNPSLIRLRRALRVGTLVAVPTFFLLTYADTFIGVHWEDGLKRIAKSRVRDRRDSILVLSSYLFRSFPTLNELGGTWGMRYPMLWQVAAFYQDTPWAEAGYHRPDQMPPEERRLMTELAEDLERYRPVLIGVDLIPPGEDYEGFDYLTYLKSDPGLRRILADYVYQETSDRLRIYRRQERSVAVEQEAISSRSNP